MAFRSPAISSAALTFKAIEVVDGTVLLSELWNIDSAERDLLRKLWDQDYRAAFPASTGPSCLLSHYTKAGAGVHGSLQGGDRSIAGSRSTTRRRTLRDIFGTPFLTHRLSLLAGQPAQRSERPTTQYSNSPTALYTDLEFLWRAPELRL